MITTKKIFRIEKCLALPLHTLTAVVTGILLIACAAEPRPPNEALQAADQAISSADKARVADSSSPDLSEAREKIIAARNATQQKQMVTGQRMAEQSRVAAELALARIEASKAKVVNTEMMKSNDSLNQEMQRNTGDTQ